MAAETEARVATVGLASSFGGLLRTVTLCSLSLLASSLLLVSPADGDQRVNHQGHRHRQVVHEHVDKTFGGKNYTELTPEEIEKLTPEDRWRSLKCSHLCFFPSFV